MLKSNVKNVQIKRTTEYEHQVICITTFESSPKQIPKDKCAKAPYVATTDQKHRFTQQVQSPKSPFLFDPSQADILTSY